SLKTRSKKEARRRALLIEKEILAGEHKHQRRAPLIEDVVHQYLEHLRAEERSEKTIRKYQFCFDLLLEVAACLKVARISHLGITMVDRYRAERVRGSAKRKPAKPKTIHNDTVCIRQLVNFALRRELLLDDPLKGFQIKKPTRTP
ncbi:MAG: site-specific integrase, partial [Planctomycetes bacterium]|nr:site-specific integrase [Planctomycetota bacterium]